MINAERPWLNNKLSLGRSLAALNRLNDERDPVERCNKHFRVLNPLWDDFYRFRARNDLLTVAEREKGRSDSQGFPALLRLGLEREQKLLLIRSEAVRDLATLRPYVLDHSAILARHDDVSTLRSKDRSKAMEEHKELCKAIDALDTAADDDVAMDRAIDALATMLYVIRCNIAHGHKTPQGPDLEKLERDETVSRQSLPIIEMIWSTLLRRPEHRLAVYGTLRKGEPNHGAVASIDGVWVVGLAQGRLINDGLPRFQWAESNSIKIEVDVLTSPRLPDCYDRLDRFEGASFRRELVPVEIDGSLLACNMYVSVH